MTLLKPIGGGVRQRSSSTSSSSTSSDGESVHKPLENPVDVLKSVFALNASTKAWMEQQKAVNSFCKPSEEELGAYDLEVVRAIREGNIDNLRQMLAAGRQFNACNRFGESLIHMACRRGDVHLVSFLLDEAHVNPEICDDFGRTPLHDACWTSSPNLEVVGLLLKKVPPSMFLTRDVRGHTPFQYARREHWPIWVGFLRENASVLLQRVSILVALE